MIKEQTNLWHLRELTLRQGPAVVSGMTRKWPNKHLEQSRLKIFSCSSLCKYIGEKNQKVCLKQFIPGCKGRLKSWYTSRKQQEGCLSEIFDYDVNIIMSYTKLPEADWFVFFILAAFSLEIIKIKIILFFILFSRRGPRCTYSTNINVSLF